MTDYTVEGRVDSALQALRALLPGCSAAVGIVIGADTLPLRTASIGPAGARLIEGDALFPGIEAMQELSPRITPCGADPAARQVVISVPVVGRNLAPHGVLQVLVDREKVTDAVLSTINALSSMVAEVIQLGRLNRDLQHSLNQLFLVYEVGRTINLSSSLDDVLLQIRDQLAGTLNFRHCCILLQGENRASLNPEAGVGIDAQWMHEAHVEVRRSLAARVIESGMAESESDAEVVARLDLPELENGRRPAAVVSAPLQTRRGIIGFLELYAAVPYTHSLDEIFLLSVLATEMATAVENAQLYASLREKEASLTILAHKLIHSQEEERRRIARDLHDGLAQTIVSAFQHVQVHAYTLPDGADRADLDRAMNLLTECIQESRNVIFDLRPATLDDFGLVDALRQFLTQLEADLGWEVLFSAKGFLEPLPPALETAVFRMVKEAVTNARKHARTAKIDVRLRHSGRNVGIHIRDWGRGFNPGESVATQTGQFGLAGMKERVSLLHGTFQVRSKPGAGTLIRIVLPLE